MPEEQLYLNHKDMETQSLFSRSHALRGNTYPKLSGFELSIGGTTTGEFGIHYHGGPWERGYSILYGSRSHALRGNAYPKCLGFFELSIGSITSGKFGIHSHGGPWERGYIGFRLL